MVFLVPFDVSSFACRSDIGCRLWPWARSHQDWSRSAEDASAAQPLKGLRVYLHSLRYRNTVCDRFDCALLSDLRSNGDSQRAGCQAQVAQKVEVEVWERSDLLCWVWSLGLVQIGQVQPHQQSNVESRTSRRQAEIRQAWSVLEIEQHSCQWYSELPSDLGLLHGVSELRRGYQCLHPTSCLSWFADIQTSVVTHCRWVAADKNAQCYKKIRAVSWQDPNVHCETNLVLQVSPTTVHHPGFRVCCSALDDSGLELSENLFGWLLLAFQDWD